MTMARGKKTPPEVIYQVMASWAVTSSLKETSDKTGVPLTTVKNIVDRHRDDEEFVKLRNEKSTEFAQAATDIITKGLKLLERRFDRAIDQEESLDVLIDEIYATDREELSQDEKNRLVAKIRSLQLQDIKAITTAIGTLYDKRALAQGNATQNINVIGDDKLAKLAELAGYERKQ